MFLNKYLNILPQDRHQSEIQMLNHKIPRCLSYKTGTDLQGYKKTVNRTNLAQNNGLNSTLLL